MTAFNRQELNEILAVYGRMVAAGEWRDYALDMGKDAGLAGVPHADRQLWAGLSELDLQMPEGGPQ